MVTPGVEVHSGGSAVPGGVAGDSFLVDKPCVWGSVVNFVFSFLL